MLLMFLLLCAGVCAEERIRFKPGAISGTVEAGVLRGERNVYVVGAARGQTMKVQVGSPEDNVVFQIEGLEEGEARSWKGVLPRTGDYRIVVGTTRGNGSYRLTVTIP